MKGMLRDSQQWLAAQLNKHVARHVVYQRDRDEVEVTATIGKSTYQQDDGEGTLTRAQVRDYLIDTAMLVIAGEPTLPRGGDRIRESDGDKVFIYEVMSLGSEAPWRYSDPFRLKLRIHTKLISTENF